MKALKIIVIATGIVLISHCSSDFAGSQAGFGGGGNNPKKPTGNTQIGTDPVPCNSKIQTCSNGKPVDPGPTSFPPGLDTTAGGVVARNVRSLFFSGNGPGSCGGAQDCVGTSPDFVGPHARQCIAPSVALAKGAQGDCFQKNTRVKITGQVSENLVSWQWPADLAMVCQGNRVICSETGTTAAALTTNLVISEVPCEQVGMLAAGPANENFHILGIALSGGGYSQRYLCKNVIAAKDIKNGDALVTALEFRRQLTDTRSEIAPPCDAGNGWEKVAEMPDCMKATGQAADGLCSGKVTICQKKEKVSF